MGKTQERLERLSEFLSQKGRLELADIKAYFQVSESTARRMCKIAEEEGFAFRTCGGGLQTIQAAEVSESGYDFERKSVEHPIEKQLIGDYAARLVKDGELIFATGGTTVECFVRSLAKRIENNELKHALIMTNSIRNAEILGDMASVVLTGGIYRPKRRDVAGIASEATIRGAHFNRSFIGVDGIELSDGLMALDEDTGNMDRLVTSRSDQVFILTDSSKFHTKSFISYEHFLPKHTIITDDGLDQALLLDAGEQGIKIIRCTSEE